MDRPCGGTASMIDGAQACRDYCGSKGYAYVGFDSPHDDGGEIHCEGGGEEATTSTAPGEEECSELISTSGGHCSGPPP